MSPVEAAAFAEITAAQIAELRDGDFVELRSLEHDGFVVRGFIRHEGETKYIGPNLLCWDRGRPASWVNEYRLTVVERAPDPIYVNHRRGTPVRGDVVRNADDLNDSRVWMFTEPDGPLAWVESSDHCRSRDQLPERLLLLVDGQTGWAVRLA